MPCGSEIPVSGPVGRYSCTPPLWSEAEKDVPSGAAYRVDGPADTERGGPWPDHEWLTRLTPVRAQRGRDTIKD
ncbi:MAG TPA: hypothetical protein VJX66_08755 [Amycolatopsis sp.]|nr:hypothetical protein [Amycolatopsis sp.]